MGKAGRKASLKKRIIIIFVLSLLVPFLCVTAVSYNTMYNIQKDKYQENIGQSLAQAVFLMDNALTDLKQYSLFTSHEGNVGGSLYRYISAEEPYEQHYYKNMAKEEMNLILSVNANIGYIMYFEETPGQVIMESYPRQQPLLLEELPYLHTTTQSTYYGPWPSSKSFSDNLVFSLCNRLILPEPRDIFVYIESDYDIRSQVFDTHRLGEAMGFLVLNHRGEVVFSELEEIKAGSSPALPEESGRLLEGYYYYFDSSRDWGYQVVALIPRMEYNREIYSWYVKMVAMLLLFLAVSIVVAILIWSMVYKPLQRFQKEITRVPFPRPEGGPRYTNLVEFDHVLETTETMRQEILDLIDAIVKKEKRRSELEVEKLLYQINPHFLMNTLNTIQWMAKSAGQSEINRVVRALNRLLMYNLGKLSAPGPIHPEHTPTQTEGLTQFSSLEMEVEAVKQYLILQQCRYDFEYRIETEGDCAAVTVPRFILQPLVENALLHGLGDDTFLDIRITEEGQGAVICVCDNGPGMPQEQVDRLLDSKQDGLTMGIGLNYVMKILESIYGGGARLDIYSRPGQGTRITLHIPPLVK